MGESRAEPIGHTRAGIGLVDHDRHRPRTPPAAPGRKIGGHGDVTSEADHHVGRDVVEHGPSLLDRQANPPRQANQIAI